MKLFDPKLQRRIGTLEHTIAYLERQVEAKQRQITKQLEHFMELEDNYAKATKRAHRLQLENNRLKKIESLRERR